jgi:hypothetical protein
MRGTAHSCSAELDRGPVWLLSRDLVLVSHLNVPEVHPTHRG